MEEEQEEQNKEQKKISLPEAIMMVGLVAFADALEILVDLTGIGIIAGELINLVVGAGLQLWLFMKGIKGFWKLASWGIGTLLDGVLGGLLPIKTISLIVTIYLVNHPKTAKVAQLATGKISSIAKVGAMGEAK